MLATSPSSDLMMRSGPSAGRVAEPSAELDAELLGEQSARQSAQQLVGRSVAMVVAAVAEQVARSLLAIGRRPCQIRHGSNLFAELRETPALFSWKGPSPLCSHCPQQMFS